MKHVARNIGIAAALALAAVGTASAKDDVLMDKCIAHFVSKQFPAFGGKITVHKSTDSGSYVPLIARREHVEISAVDPASGATLATATCKSGKDGLMVSIKSTLDGETKVVKTIKPEAVLSDAG